MKDIFTYIFPHKNPIATIRNYLPDKSAYFFSSGREALYVALKHRRTLSKKKYVALPGWGCPIVLATIDRAGFKPLLLDISTRSLHIDIQNLVELSQHYDIDGALLIAENGIPYNTKEIQTLQQHDVCVIADYAIGWQNINNQTTHISDFEIFSGGFSKPISGLGSGILTTQSQIQITQNLPQKQAASSLIQMAAHIVFQQPMIYKFIKPILPFDLQTVYIGEIHHYSKRSAAVVVNSLIKIERIRQKWISLQNSIRTTLIERKSQAPLVFYGDHLHTKILFEKRLLKANLKPLIEFHQQYPYDLLSDPRGEKIDSDYENINRIRSDYISCAINHTAIQNRVGFIQAWNDSLL